MKARISIVLGVLAIASPAAADIDGKYKFDSSDDMGGAEFMAKPGNATIKKLGKAFTITHGFMGGPGLGLKGGTKSAFFCVPVRGGCGIAVYKIEKNGALTGTWSADAKKGTTSTEKWAEADGAAGQAEDDEERSLAGTYSIVGTNPGKGGGQYKGTVTVVANENGPGYTVTWEVAGQTYKGVGAEVGGYFGVAYGGDMYWLAAYHVHGKTLGGQLLTSGFEAFGDPDDPESQMQRYYDDVQKKK
jgi:hypothetical protein